MKKDIYSNIKDSDALENFFEYINSCSLNSERVDLKRGYYTKYFEPNKVN